MKINKIITRFIIFNICISLFILFTADHIIPFHNIEAYTYENDQIIVHSLSEYFEIFLNILFLVISICTAVFIVIAVMNRIKYKEKFAKKVILLIISWFIALVLFFSVILRRQAYGIRGIIHPNAITSRMETRQ